MSGMENFLNHRAFSDKPKNPDRLVSSLIISSGIKDSGGMLCLN